jgi:hypothetical protein
MFHEYNSRSALKGLFLFATLLASPCVMLAQRSTGGFGGGLAGGGGLSGGNGIASGIDTKDDLKDFHEVLALQASKLQIGEYRLMMKSTEAASAEVQTLVEQARAEDRAKLNDSATALSAAIEQARTENTKFLEQLSDRQKSGLRETIRKLNKTDSELSQQVKALSAGIADARTGNLQIANAAENLKSILAGLHDQQLELGDEMSITSGASGGEGTFSIAPVQGVVNFENQPVAITTSGVVSKVDLPGVKDTFRVDLTIDLSDLQQNLTEVLRQQLHKSDPCGEQIVVQNAVLTPSAPASTVLAQLHYERWTCFGGRGNANEMAEGNGSMEVTLTPTVAEDGTLRLSAAISRVDAEGMIGDSLRSGALGETVRDAVADSLLSAVRQGSDYKTVLPAAAQGYAKLQRAMFQAMGAGELSIVLSGSMQLPSDKAALIEAELVGAKNGTAAEPVAPAPASPR